MVCLDFRHSSLQLPWLGQPDFQPSSHMAASNSDSDHTMERRTWIVEVSCKLCDTMGFQPSLLDDLRS